MAKRLDNKKDILLLLLYAPGSSRKFNEAIVGRTRLVKMLFLFLKESLNHFKKGTSINSDNFYEFFPWNFGPFSKQIYDDLTFFVLRGFIDPTTTDEEVLPEAAAEWNEWMTMSSQDPNDIESVTEFDEESFRLSEKGEKFASELYESLSTEQKNILAVFKSKINSTPLKAILKYVYQAYPESTTNSQILEKVMGNT